MSTFDIGQILQNALLSREPQERLEAQAQLENASKENFVMYVTLLTNKFADESAKVEIRMLAALAFKNELTSKDSRKKKEVAKRWVDLEDSFKANIRSTTLKVLFTENEKVSRQISQLVAAIADIDLPLNAWPDLISIIVEKTKAGESESFKKAALLTIGYICDIADPGNEGIRKQANGILLAIVQGAQSTEPSIGVRIAALTALVNSLEFINYNFKNENERNYIMQVVCEATNAESSELKTIAFGALAKIMSYYYTYMSLYMEKALFTLTISGMQSNDEDVACMAIEFWSTVCEEEIERSSRLNELPDQFTADDPDLILYNFGVIAANEIIPTLLTLLTKQNDDIEDDDWNVAMAAGSCLQLFAQNVGDHVVAPTLAFVEANIGSDNWREREAAIMAFGSILDGPSQVTLKGFISEALIPILSLMDDSQLQVKETVAWCLGRIADLVVDVLRDDRFLENTIGAIIKGLEDHPKISTNCCWALINLAEQLAVNPDSLETSPLSKYYPLLVPLLIKLSDKPDNEFSSRASIYEALSMLVLYSANDTLSFVDNIANEMVKRLQVTIEMMGKVSGMDDKVNLQELQTSILNLLTNVIRRVKNNISAVSDNLMEIFLKLLDSQKAEANSNKEESASLIEEDVFIAISAIASTVGSEFIKYMPTFLPFLSTALNNTESPVSNTAVGLVADIARSLQDNIIPFCDGLMNILGDNLSNSDLRKELRPAIISCFGDIAASIGNGFLPYLDVVMKILAAAQSIQFDDGTVEAYEYLFDVKESILDAYVGIVAGLQGNPEAIYPYVNNIIQFLSTVASDYNCTANDSICGSSVGLIGDMAQMYGDSINPLLSEVWVLEFLKHVRNNVSFNQNTRITAKWAKKLIVK